MINKTDEFYLGVDAFNQQDYKKTHHIWEQSWKPLRNSENRFYLKSFIMLAVSYQNYFHDIELTSEIIRRNAGLEDVHNIGSGLKLTNYLKSKHNVKVQIVPASEELKSFSSHQVDIYHLKGQYWKWRIHGGAISLSNQLLEKSNNYDLIYFPAENFIGTDEFSFYLSSMYQPSVMQPEPTTFTVNVTPVNDPPWALGKDRNWTEESRLAGSGDASGIVQMQEDGPPLEIYLAGFDIEGDSIVYIFIFLILVILEW